ncbi:HEAT repeat domain-containing protein [Methylorubrum extorquens]|uniref:HEAT repeat domain-containing protein n=1 Tax=Methylorubrum extorquens TaxID=408 RepID=A0AAX3WCX1_METEX|nr:HEAT repeat domain-containing protein [Methylorubrum extorquens]WHQ68599.1 HEAT repeat domain-containing protein [Methylorubrum extorquens]
MREVHEVDTPIPASWVTTDLVCASAATIGDTNWSRVPRSFRFFRIVHGRVLADVSVANEHRIPDDCWDDGKQLLDAHCAAHGIVPTIRVPDLPRVAGLAAALAPDAAAPQVQVAALLWRAGRADLDLLVTAFESNRDPDVRRRIAYALARLGPDASTAVPMLTAALQAPNGHALTYAIGYALASIGAPAAPALKLVATALEATGRRGVDMQIRMLIDAVAAEDERATERLVELLPVLQQSTVLRYVGRKLAEFGPHVLPRVIEIFRSARDDEQREELAYVLRAFGSEGAPALDCLLEALSRTQSDDLRGALCEAINVIGLRSLEALPVVLEAFRSCRNEWPMGRFCDLLGNFGSSAVDALAKEFQAARNDGARTVLAKALGRIGPAAIASAECLSAAAATSDNEVLLRALAEALGRIGAPTETGFTAQVAALQASRFEYDRERIIKVLDPGSAPPLAAIEDLAEILVDARESPANRNLAVVLSGIGARALAPLISALSRSQADESRVLIAHALGRMGAEAAPAMNGLVAALMAAEGDRVRLQIVDEVRRIGRPSAAHLDGLIHLLRRSSELPVLWRLSLAIADVGELAIEPLAGLRDATQNNELRRAITNALSQVVSKRL